jgi:hypothetical protein
LTFLLLVRQATRILFHFVKAFELFYVIVCLFLYAKLFAVFYFVVVVLFVAF